MVVGKQLANDCGWWASTWLPANVAEVVVSSLHLDRVLRLPLGVPRNSLLKKKREEFRDGIVRFLEIVPGLVPGGFLHLPS